ncbi:MAG: hypothetical protein WD708_11870 [Kiritimatiellia bacterium]
MNYDHAIKNPAGAFNHPGEVVENASLTTDQKLKILRQWEYDARELEVAEEENMGGGPDDQLAWILQAIASIHQDPSKNSGANPGANSGAHPGEEPGVNSKQGGEG